MKSIALQPAIADVIEFVRDFGGFGRSVTISRDTWLDADLGITGDDGSDLLEEAARRFGAALAGEDGYRSTFGLGPNEYLFHPEGMDLVGIGKLMNWAFRRKVSVVRDLTVGQLHEAICRTQAAAQVRPNQPLHPTPSGGQTAADGAGERRR